LEKEGKKKTPVVETSKKLRKGKIKAQLNTRDGNGYRYNKDIGEKITGKGAGKLASRKERGSFCRLEKDFMGWCWGGVPMRKKKETCCFQRGE